MISLLHVGCGGETLPPWLMCDSETRLDIDPTCEPDIVTSMVALGDIGPFDLVYSSHSLEHLFPQEANTALAEFHRVLGPGGSVVIFVPDLEDVLPNDTVLYESPAGPITGMDLIYGHACQAIANPYMAHHCGFTRTTLMAALQKAGFATVEVTRVGAYNLIGMGKK